ncbi:MULTISPECIES: DUF4286 family protein [Gabonibacter]|uniref:DUF4286 family protein n=1 Tax=Gabonibacter TaxID=1911312 RepID=UPI00073F2386|nr:MULTISPECIES: DUF4286 family protein [Gabonibacter]MCR9012596.1 DUF4286 family protein [Gabonibacter chumensis]
MRYVYNTTFHVENDTEASLINWMQNHHLPAIREKGLCSDILFTRIKTQEPQGKSFSLQLIFPAEKDYQAFLEKHQEELLKKLLDQFDQQVLYFSTLLEEI